MKKVCVIFRGMMIRGIPGLLSSPVDMKQVNMQMIRFWRAGMCVCVCVCVCVFTVSSRLNERQEIPDSKVFPFSRAETPSYTSSQKFGIFNFQCKEVSPRLHFIKKYSQKNCS